MGLSSGNTGAEKGAMRPNPMVGGPMRYNDPVTRSQESSHGTGVPLFLTVVPIANTVQVGADVKFGVDGRLAIVQPTPFVVPRGRIYLEVEIWESSTKANLIAKPWAGYITNSPRTAYPNIYVLADWVVRLRATQASTAGTGLTVTVICTIEPGVIPMGPGFFFYDVPGEGRGEPRTLSLGNPAPGADYPAQVLPAQVKWVLQGFVGVLVTAVAAANRHLLIYMNAGAVATGFCPAVASQPASLSVSYYGVRGPLPTDELSAIAGQINAVGLTDVPGYGTGYYPTGTDTVTISTLNLQAADDWGNGTLIVEEWAMP